MPGRLILTCKISLVSVVVILIPIFQRWRKSCNISAKKFLNFAFILGGTCILIGTSTKLDVYRLLQSTSPLWHQKFPFLPLGNS